MDEIRKKDVLRLFFGKEHKHYLVEKVGQHTIKLKTEEGTLLQLVHKQGKLTTIGDATITGFEILRDPSRYNHYYIGAEVAVQTYDGKSFKGDIVENDDGMLKIKTDNGKELYVDLDRRDKVELVGNKVIDEQDEVVLPDEIDDLFFIKVGCPRVYELFRTQNIQEEPILPYWIVPILDPNKCKLDLSDHPVLDIDGLNAWSLKTNSTNEVFSKVAESILFNTIVYNDKIKSTYTYVSAPNTTLPVVEYAFLSPLPFCVPQNNVNTHLAVRIGVPTENTKRFDNIADARSAYTPNVSAAGSAFEADIQMYPLVLTSSQLKTFTPPKQIQHTQISAPKKNIKHTRSLLSAAYNGCIREDITPSEMFSRMFEIDFADSYFSKKSKVKKTHTKEWVLEKNNQRLKSATNTNTPYPKEAIAILNEIYALFHKELYSDFLYALEHYGRTAGENENNKYLYFSAPVFSKCKLMPIATEYVARMCRFRGTSCMKTVLDHFTYEDGLLIDYDSGFVLSKGINSEITSS